MAPTKTTVLHIICLFLTFTLLIEGSALQRNERSIQVSQTDNGSSTYIELLRGRDGHDGHDGHDGLTGRDGLPGPAGAPGGDGHDGKQGEKGEPGMDGATGAAGPQGPRGIRGPAGVIYTRWGKSSCPDIPGTELFYSGRAGGTFYNKKGGGANYLCMPEDPEYSNTLTYRPGVQGPAYVYGAEYETPLQGIHDHNVPCAVCYVSTRSAVYMIPAKASCPLTWTREYYGYLMTEGDYDDRGRKMFECVDQDQESLPGSSANNNGAVFYHVEASCNGLPCPTYDPAKELNCVVCSK